MKNLTIKKRLSSLLLWSSSILTSLPLGGLGWALTSCKEDIDESNLYTFTGETIEDYLANRSEQFSSFNYILKRIGYDKILSAYGTYTCFAPTNDAVDIYLDSLYNDPLNTDLPHNGMKEPGLEGLTDSLCKDIALFHLYNSVLMGVDMGNGMTIKTMLGRDITTTIDPETGAMLVNRSSTVTEMDIELENGIVHQIDCVIRRSNRLVAGELENAEGFTLFSKALTLTGLADSLINTYTSDFAKVSNPMNFYVPDKCELGYTIFAESDQVMAEHGINSIEDLKAYADSVYGSCASGNGWYDYARNHNIQISTGDDYKNPWNTLSMFVRYHILEFKIPFEKLVPVASGANSKAQPVEYYETMLPYTLLKITKNSNKVRLNRWVANNTLTDQIGELGSAAMHTLLFEGIDLTDAKKQFMPLNGYIHPVKAMLAYEEFVPHGSLNERMRLDATAFFPEMLSNSFRGCTTDFVRKLNGGVQGGPDGRHTADYIRFPAGFFKNVAFYNGDGTRFYYFPHTDPSWSNYQCDEFNIMGNYDFAFRLPPVPDGTYELRIGYTAEDGRPGYPQGIRGMLQFYLGTSSSVYSMKALDIPLDMRHIPLDGDHPELTVTIDKIDTDVITGWSDYTKYDDLGVETDADMRNMGYMRGPLAYHFNSTLARAYKQDLRRIITRQDLKQDEYWLRCKSVLINPNCEFHLDYIELCPENVYNNTQYLEDMY